MQRRMDAAVRARRWIPVGGMWVEPDCNLPSGESFVRQLLYGKGWVRDGIKVLKKQGNWRWTRWLWSEDRDDPARSDGEERDRGRGR